MNSKNKNKNKNILFERGYNNYTKKVIKTIQSNINSKFRLYKTNYN